MPCNNPHDDNNDTAIKAEFSATLDLYAYVLYIYTHIEFIVILNII